MMRKHTKLLIYQIVDIPPNMFSGSDESSSDIIVNDDSQLVSSRGKRKCTKPKWMLSGQYVFS